MTVWLFVVALYVQVSTALFGNTISYYAAKVGITHEHMLAMSIALNALMLGFLWWKWKR